MGTAAAGALLLSACGADAADSDAAAAEAPSEDVSQDATDDDTAQDEATSTDDGAEADGPAAGAEQALPANMPAGIPIPDEHMVLRTDSLVGADADVDLGEHVAANIAIGGTVEEQRAHYESELRDAYGDLEIEQSTSGDSLRFGGEWFENAQVFVTENEGHLDNGDLDSSHLPVMLSVQVWEFSLE